MSAYEVDRFLHDVAADDQLRDRAQTAPAAALENYDLTEAERHLLLTGQVGLLYRAGVNDFLLHNVVRFGLFGVDLDSYSARMRAERPAHEHAAPATNSTGGTPMPAVAKFVLLPLLPERREEFLELLHANRRHTKEEPGTQLWSLHSVREQPDSVAMYEVYDDEDASVAHDTGNPALAEILQRLPEFLSGEPTILTLDVTATRQDP